MSPTFHAGELALQDAAGVTERMARLGSQMIRDHLTEQHREFFPMLPFVIVGSLDEHGQPTASLLAAPPGFAWSPDAATLRLDATPLPGDPLAQNLHVGAPLAVLGIQAHTRRRNRANGDVTALDAHGFSLGVRQSFGNCPKYIHPREAFYVGALPPQAPHVSERLGPRERELITKADTFFLASAHPSASASGAARAEGVDVSHRGGPPGFAAFTDDDTFVLADYSGNNLYMTLGNLQLNPLAGLLFQDRANGDVLQLEARIELTTAPHPQAGPSDTGRVLQIRALRARYFAGASPLRFGPEE